MNVQDTGNEIEQIGEHDLDEASEALLGFIYDFQNKLPIAINHYFAKKFGYDPDKRPIGFQVDFQKKKVHCMSPKMNREQRRKAGVEKTGGLEVTE
jgi:hypothetical protein